MPIVQLDHASEIPHGLAYQKGRSAASNIRRRLILSKVEPKMVGKSVVPSIELSLKRGHLLERQFMGCGSRVDLLENSRKDASSSEESESTGEAGVFTRESGLETLLGDILVIGIAGVLGLNVLLPQELGKSKKGSGEAVKGVQRPEDLLPCLDGQGTEGEALLALVKSEAVGKSDGNTLVVLKSLVVSAHGAVEKSKGEALEGVHSVLHENGIESLAPLLLTCGKLWKIGSIRRQAGNVENQVKLSELVIALDFLGIGDELLVDSEKSGLVKNGEERSPFLKVDVDASIREQTRRNSQ